MCRDLSPSKTGSEQSRAQRSLSQTVPKYWGESVSIACDPKCWVRSRPGIRFQAALVSEIGPARRSAQQSLPSSLAVKDSEVATLI